MKPRAALFHDYPARDGDVFGGGRRERIAALTELHPHVVNGRNFAEHAPALGDVEVIFASWGLPSFTDAHFAALPKLRAVFYAAGNVKAFATPLVERGVVLVSAWAVNAIPTAELVLSQILLTCRGYFRSVRQYAATQRPRAPRRTSAARAPPARRSASSAPATSRAASRRTCTRTASASSRARAIRSSRTSARASWASSASRWKRSSRARTS